MSSSGRRHEMTFLAIAVGVLVVAVALLVGLRSFPKRQPRRAEPQGAKQVPTARGERRPAEEGRKGRDPFASRHQDKGGGAPKRGGELKLVGIVEKEGRRPMAVIRAGEQRYYASLGERAAGYRVVSVEEDRAVLEGEGGRITLLLGGPKKAAGGLSEGRR